VKGDVEDELPAFGVADSQIHRPSREIFWNPKMTKRRVAEHAAWPHIWRARIWGVHPHATASEERSESWQNPCLLRERSRETPFCARNLKRVSAFDAQLCIGTSLYMQVPHRSGRASSSRGLCSPFNDQVAGLQAIPAEGAAWIDIGYSGGQKETPERSPRSSILSADPHHPAGPDKTSRIGLICATSFVPYGTP